MHDHHQPKHHPTYSEANPCSRESGALSNDHSRDNDGAWRALYEASKLFTPDFMETREQPEAQEREDLRNWLDD